MGYAPKPLLADDRQCPRCRRWKPMREYRTVDVETGCRVRAVLCECGWTFDRDAPPPLPRIRDAGPAFTLRERFDQKVGIMMDSQRA